MFQYVSYFYWKVQGLGGRGGRMEKFMQETIRSSMKDWQTLCQRGSGCSAAACSQNDDGRSGVDRCMLPVSQTELPYFIG